MGREYIHLNVTATLSKHNSEQDWKDEDTWEEFQRRVMALCDLPEFASISPWIL